MCFFPDKNIVFVHSGDFRCSLDYIFPSETSNIGVFDFMKPLFVSASEGYNVCLIAYGASGSGKSHTMQGNQEDPGIIPKAVNFLLDKEVELQISIFEIYNDAVIDLISTENSKKQKFINGAPEVSQCHVDSIEKFMEIYESSNNRRNVGQTQRNEKSSRSHAAVHLSLKRSDFKSTMLLFDLAGAESAADHLVEDENQHLRKAEMTKINQSISGFSLLVENLSKGCFADFRNSNLTKLLKPYLTTNSKTTIIATFAEDAKYLASSKKTLSVANAAKNIKIPNVKKNK